MESLMETPETTIETKTAAATILKRCVCLMLTCGYLGNSKKVDVAQFKILKTGARDAETGVTKEEELTGREKKQVRMQKRLMDSEVFKSCRHAIEAAKHMLRARSAAMGHRVFGAGTYLVPVSDLLTVVEELKLARIEVAQYADELAAKWDAIVAERKADLGALFNAAEYATADEVRLAFKLDWSFVSFEAPDQLAEVDQAIYEAAVEKNNQNMADAFEEVVIQLRANALKIMQQLVERLKPGADGKKKALHGTALRDLQEFVALLPKRNITDDAELDAAVAAVAAYAEGIDVSVLKAAPAVRAGLQAKAEEAIQVLEGLVANAASRGISFGPIPEDA